MDDAWSGRLAELYRELDAAIAQKGWSCRGCGDCCHFDAVDHILYASEMERRHLVATASPSPNPDGDAERISKGLRCPYQENSRCLARDGRPLGCRLHFCEVPNDDVEAFYEQWHQRLKSLHEEAGIPWNYRPLLPLL